MNRKWLVLILIVHCTTFRVLLADSETPDASWVSPNKKLTLYARAFDTFMGEDVKPIVKAVEENMDRPCAFILIEGQKVSCVGVVNYDNSAHGTHAVWSPDSKKVLLLIRENRAGGEIGVLDVAEGKIRTTGSDVIEDMEQRVFEKNGDIVLHVAEKSWFGSWKWTSNSTAEGIIVYAKSGMYEETVKLTLKGGVPQLTSISSRRITEEESRKY